jgi:hypothetical protein
MQPFSSSQSVQEPSAQPLSLLKRIEIWIGRLAMLNITAFAAILLNSSH